MEILSDATFRGATTFKKDVTISGGDFFVRRNDNTSLFHVVLDKDGSDIGTEIVHIDSDANIEGHTNINGKAYLNNGAFIQNSLCLTNFNKITANGKSITFPSTDGTLALTSQIPTVPSMAGVAHFCSIQINFDVAADCTRFYVGRTPNLPYGPASLQMFTDRLPNGGTGYYLKNVDLGVEKIDMGNPYIFVEKSSSFAISASDGYSVRIVY